MNEELLKQMIAERYVNVQKHPTADLYIHNYSATCQYDNMWNEVTLQCRGLIRDGQGNVVARPFPKFFNYEQVPNLPAENFIATEKMDGSLGILYFNAGLPFIATRGSFVSEQAQRANKILWTKYGGAIAAGKFNPDYTYLFEIIYPENRIVVNYGDMEDLVLLTVIHTATGREYSYEDLTDIGQTLGCPVVKKYDGLADFKTLEQQPNSEGYVISYASGLRVKIKFDEYKRLHRLVTGVNAKTIWELLKNGDSYEELLDRVPDEFYEWVKSTVRDLQGKYDEIETLAKSEFEYIKGTVGTEDRKTFALNAKVSQYPQLLFAMLDGKDYEPAIWKMLRPAAEKPFKMEIE